MDTVTAPSVNSYEVAVQREMRIMATKIGEMRGLLDTALDMLAVIAKPLPNGSQVKQVLYAEIDAMRSAANAIQARDLALESKT